MSLDEIPNIDRKTSKAFELALTVVFESGIQHLAESPEGTKKQPEEVIDYLQHLPATWEDTKFVDGYPGEFAVMARKGEGRWFVAGINGTSEDKLLKLDLSFIGETDSLVLITDNADKSGFEVKEIAANESFEMDFSAYGGFVLFQLK